MTKLFNLFAERAASFAGQPWAFMLAFMAVLLWVVTGPIFQFSETWQLVINTGTTIVTFLMIFLVQNSQNRDASAMQAKLDELIRSVRSARAEFIGIEHLTDNEIEEIRSALEKRSGKGAADKGGPSHETVNRLLLRR